MSKYKHLLDEIKNGDLEEKRNIHQKPLLIDALNLFFRNFAVINSVNTDGIHVGGLGGFLRSLGSLIKTIEPTCVYLVFDGVGSSSSRKNLLPEYKDGRNLVKITNYDVFENVEEENEAKISQISRLIDYLQCLPVKVLSIDKCEADDVIAFMSVKIPEIYPESRVVIVSNDKDYIQLINDNVTLYRPAEKLFLTKNDILKKYNVIPENFVHYKILLGDNSDKIRGITDLGEKSIPVKFPQLKEQKISFNELIEFAGNNIDKHITYSRVYVEKDRLELSYKLMNLSSPLISERGIEEIIEKINDHKLEYHPTHFMQMYESDKIGKLITNPKVWLEEVFKPLLEYK